MEYQTSETTINIHHQNNDQKLAKLTKHSDLYVLIHGLHGTRQDFQFIKEKLKELYNHSDNDGNTKYIIIDCSSNEGKTGDGIEVLGMNVLKEVLTILYESKVSVSNFGEKMKLSVIGHSLGGLIGRYFIKLLYDLPNSELPNDFLPVEYRKYFVENVFPYLVPCSFTTISTPHLGSRRSGGTYFGSAYRFAAHTFLTFLGKTGKELILNDGNSIEESLLYRMSLPDSDFVKVLKLFPYRTLISSCHFDSTVPFPSASIRSFNPYPINDYGNAIMKVGGISGEFLNSPQYVSLFSQFFTMKKVEETDLNERVEILKRASWKGTELDPFEGNLSDKNKNLYHDNYDEVEFEGKMLKNLQDIKWRRIDLDFTVSSFIQAREIHVIVVRKKMPIIGSSEMDHCGERCVALISSLCKFDSDHLFND